jgi:hypothetical protein
MGLPQTITRVWRLRRTLGLYPWKDGTTRLATVEIRTTLRAPKVARTAHGARMADSEEEPVMLPFRDKMGTGWHVVIRYHKGHERRIEGFTTEKEALEWIIANSKQVDE